MRRFLAIVVGALVLLVAPTAAAAPPTLRALAARHDIRIGTAVDMSALAADPVYRRQVGSEFSTVTAENVMKWEVLEPQRGQYDWSAADRLMAFARQHGQAVRGHVLVWHSQLPAWLTAGSFSSDQLRQILRKHIFDTVGHFKGRIWQWDVVNEAFNEDGTLRDTIWLEKLGPGYIADAFRWAHEADPSAKLFYNDYNIEDVNAKSDAVYQLVKTLRAQGVPVEGVGMQAHETVDYTPTTMRQNMQRFQRLGLDTAVTEADVRMVMPPDAAKLGAQADVYRSMLSDCLATDRCISFTVWGFTDKYSWVPGTFEGQGAANLLDETFTPKPAYDAVRATLAAKEHRG
ncbi:endo-1,4-beta-xylanase [Amycolatopsis acidiphila]|uniref:Beta-xylanase n=1 Tax=Amycolatopsis acidiphila TaxID=715473 RepID=A0A558A518_9PSEU|nr:endo-1,4-beta-xylanase [Amycolatopsis acidiphila]TVT19357.1 endo-1,4-beta-xylanase [Amycolatopsis acidiphila]UIJ61722.1 endo-1,4-beta-xylanase [Amycolatopsis acidiphila]GHG58217.1 beta-xylanase [Amycolatopsis acidiphila]